MATNESTAKTALVLSGGGAYGAYEVGVIKALYAGKSPAQQSRPLDADVFTGTSVGSFNAAVMAMDVGGAQASAARLEQIWTQDISDNSDGRGNGVIRIRGNPMDYLNPMIPGTPMEQMKRAFDDGNHLMRDAAPRIMSVLKGTASPAVLVEASALINADPFYSLVRRSIDPQALRDSRKSLHVTATSWYNGEAQEFDFKHTKIDEDMWGGIEASAAIPGVFPMVKVGDEYFVDGGVVMNTPISPAVDAGATELHVICLSPDLPELPTSHINNTLDTFNRVYAAMLATAVAEDIESARWINQGIDVLKRAADGETMTTAEGQQFMRVAGQLYRQLVAAGKLYKPLTIHKYFPRKSLGSLLGMLNFDRAAVDGMITQGYDETCAHSCAANDCVIPATA